MDARISVYDILAGPADGIAVNSFFAGGTQPDARDALLESPTKAAPAATDGLLIGRDLFSGQTRRAPTSPLVRSSTNDKGKNVVTRSAEPGPPDGIDRSALLSDPFVSGRTINRPSLVAASKFDVPVRLT